MSDADQYEVRLERFYSEVNTLYSEVSSALTRLEREERLSSEEQARLLARTLSILSDITIGISD